MSSWSDKQNEKNRIYPDSIARATAEYLENRPGFVRVSGDRIEVTSMGKLYVWLRTTGTGKTALFALQE